MNLKKELGQNFLTNQTDIKNFIDFCELKPEDNVLEIGPGNGVLTKQIATRVNKIIAVELDSDMISLLKALNIINLQIENINFLDLNLREIIEKEKITKIIGAIPYYISSPIVHKLITEATSPLQSVCLITQKEFGLKLIGKEKTRSYFTNLVEKHASIVKGNVISKNSFNPVPKVDSLFFRMSFSKYPSNNQEVKEWSKFLHHVFKTPRKKINKRFTKEMLANLQIDENLRPENLNANTMVELFNKTTKSL